MQHAVTVADSRTGDSSRMAASTRQRLQSTGRKLHRNGSRRRGKHNCYDEYAVLECQELKGAAIGEVKTGCDLKSQNNRSIAAAVC